MIRDQEINDVLLYSNSNRNVMNIHLLRFASWQALDSSESISFALFERHSFMKQDGQSNGYVMSRHDIFFFIQYSFGLSILKRNN